MPNQLWYKKNSKWKVQEGRGFSKNGNWTSGDLYYKVNNSWINLNTNKKPQNKISNPCNWDYSLFTSQTISRTEYLYSNNDLSIRLVNLKTYASLDNVSQAFTDYNLEKDTINGNINVQGCLELGFKLQGEIIITGIHGILKDYQMIMSYDIIDDLSSKLLAKTIQLYIDDSDTPIIGNRYETKKAQFSYNTNLNNPIENKLRIVLDNPTDSSTTKVVYQISRINIVLE